MLKISKFFSSFFQKDQTNNDIMEAIEKKNNGKLLQLVCNISREDINNTRNVNNMDIAFLYYAVSCENIEACRLFLEKGADVNVISAMNHTPLHASVLNSSTDIAKLLLSKGANVNAVSVHGQRPLDVAIEKKKIEHALLFCSQKRLQIQEVTIFSSLYRALVNNVKEVVECLIKNGADINAQDPVSGNTLLHLYINAGNEDVALFLEMGADPTKKNKDNMSCIALASRKEFNETANTMTSFYRMFSPNRNLQNYGNK
jgi:ankyrin repeat protein